MFISALLFDRRGGRAVVSLVAACIAGVCAAQPTQANVVTFTGTPFQGFNLETWVEDGIIAEAEAYSFGNHGIPDTALLVDSGAQFPASVSFTMAQAFQPVSFDLIPGLVANCTDFAGLPVPGCNPAYPNLSVQGYLDGALMASLMIWMGTTTRTLLLDGIFPLVDQLVIAGLRPEIFGIASCTQAPCTTFSIDNVTLQPVPLPATLPLFATALGALGLAGWRRKRKTAAEQQRGA
jgi:hypothetical protein